MPAYKDKNGTWYVWFRYNDWTGVNKAKCKRGFKTRRDAVEWERKFLLESREDPDLTFGDFVLLYEKDVRPRLKLSTWLSKDHLIRTKLLPYFEHKKLRDISTKDVMRWHNELLSYRDARGKPYSQTYLKTVHNQLSALLNHAVKHYNLKFNPASRVGSIGQKEAGEMQFWVKEEYLKFAEAIMDKPLAYYAFEMLYWCGLRVGELLALTAKDVDLEKGTVTVNKTYQRIGKQDVVTTPKTRKSNRTIKMPGFLRDEMRDLITMIYDLHPDDRIFIVTRSFLMHEMARGSKAAGVKKIRIHDLRHSHVSLLIDMGFSAVAIANRVGHESIDITYRYAHMFPSIQGEMADKLDEARKVG
ncbi:MAG: site-specific integrase [Clostridia bacterium]|nr:site-specific integrase [Clostridia bacterium]